MERSKEWAWTHHPAGMRKYGKKSREDYERERQVWLGKEQAMRKGSCSG